MYAAIRQGKIKPGKVAEAARLAREGALPLIRATRGFKSYHMVAAEDNTVTVITLFEDKAAAEESNQTMLAWLKENLAPLFDGQPMSLTGNVLIHEEA
jgi:quinol monooxygenase YgiN